MLSGRYEQPRDIIKTFYIPGEEGVSEFWRRNKSPVESIELAHLLDAILKISSFIGQNVGNIIWSVMNKPTESNDIVLDASLVLGKYPIPGNKTDIVIGMAVHEAYQRVEWCEWTRDLAMQKMGKVAPLLMNKFKLYVEMAERIYVDLVANRSILGLYVEKYRNYRFAKAAKSFDLPPSFDELLYIWWLMAADISNCKYKEVFTNEMHGNLSDSLEQYYAKPLGLLNSIIPYLIEECPKRHSVVDRCEYRANLYLSAWEELYNHTQFWAASEWDLLFVIKKPDAPEGVDVEEKPDRPMIYPMGKEIRAHLKRKELDLTDAVKVVCQDDDDVVPIVVNDIVLPLKDNQDKQLLYRLQAVVRSHAEKRNSTSRGMKSGKIDARRLYRAPLTGNIFMHKKNNYEMTNDIILVVDASGSMGDIRWETIQMVYSALYKVLINYNKNTRVFAYNDSKGKCDLTELSNRRGELFTVLPQGKTASGEAIIATAMMLKRKNKRPFIIHITDGASNWGSDVKYAIDYCKKKKIRLMTLGFGCNQNTKVALKKQYGNQVQFIENLEEFPRKFGDLLAYSKFM